MAEQYEPRAILEFGSTTIILPTDKAVEAFKLLCCGEPVQYDWAASGYKRMKPQSRDGGVSLRTFSISDYASLALNSVDE